MLDANILKPQLGLLWCYGVLVADYSLERARELCDKACDALTGLLQGTYRQSLYRLLTVEEASEIVKRVTEFRHGVTLKGVPKPREEPNRLHRFLGFKTGLRIVEMLGKVVRGLMDELGAAAPRGARLGRGRELVYILLENLKQRVDNILQMGSFHTLAVLMTRDERTCERAKALLLEPSPCRPGLRPQA